MYSLYLQPEDYGLSGCWFVAIIGNVLNLIDPIDVTLRNVKREFQCTECGHIFVGYAKLIDVSDENVDVAYTDCELCGKMAYYAEPIWHFPFPRED